jgi:hypothetical protein
MQWLNTDVTIDIPGTNYLRRILVLFKMISVKSNLLIILLIRRKKPWCYSSLSRWKEFAYVDIQNVPVRIISDDQGLLDENYGGWERTPYFLFVNA